MSVFESAIPPKNTTQPAGFRSRKEHKRLVKREKRKLKRQQEARQREEEQTNGILTPNSGQQAEENERHSELLQEQEKKQQHEMWLEREREAQEEFEKQREKEEMIKKKEEEERKRIQAEWEEKQKKEQEKLKKEKEKKDKKQHQLEGVMQYLDKGGKNGEQPWRNPDAPAPQPGSRKSQICSFYIKTGVCRFGERCSRSHPQPGISRTVLLRGMYVNFAMEQSYHDDHNDVSLEYDQETAQADFEEFYTDALPEFEKVGKVIVMRLNELQQSASIGGLTAAIQAWFKPARIRIKSECTTSKLPTHFPPLLPWNDKSANGTVCCNWERHLRGNVYVQFQQDKDAVKAVEAFNGRFYAGRALSCEHVAVEDWRMAICGSFQHGKCPKGKNCNFLHVFKNPDEHNKQFQGDHRRRADYSSRHWNYRSANRGWRSSSRRSQSRESRSSRLRSSSRRRSHERSMSRSESRLRERYRYSSKSHSKARSRSRSRSPRSKSMRTSSSRSHSRVDRSRSRSLSPRSRSRSPAKSTRQLSSRSRSRSRSYSPKSRSVSGSVRRSRSRSRSYERRTKKRSRSPAENHRSSSEGSRSRSRSRSPARRSRKRSLSKSRSRSSSESRSRSTSRSRSRSPSKTRSGNKSRTKRKKRPKKNSKGSRRGSSKVRKKKRKTVTSSKDDTGATIQNDETNRKTHPDPDEGYSCGEEEPASSGNEAESEDSDSSVEEKIKLEIVEQEIARLTKRAGEKEQKIVDTAEVPSADGKDDAISAGEHSESIQELCTDNGSTPGVGAPPHLGTVNLGGTSRDCSAASGIPIIIKEEVEPSESVKEMDIVIKKEPEESVGV